MMTMVNKDASLETNKDRSTNLAVANARPVPGDRGQHVLQGYSLSVRVVFRISKVNILWEGSWNI